MIKVDKRKLKRMFFLAIASGILVGLNNYMGSYIPVQVDALPMAQMEQNIDFIEEQIHASIEANELSLAIRQVNHVNLASNVEISELRRMYENASKDAKRLVDEDELIALEEEYRELELHRQENFQRAAGNADLNGMLDYSQVEITVSGDEELDLLVEQFIAQATSTDMTRHEKILACYDYMVANYTYADNYNYGYDGRVKSIHWAKAFLRDGYGTCNHWNAAFMYISRALGYNTRLCYGSTASSRGGAYEHYWTEISLDGTMYVFDPQVEADIARKVGGNCHMRYGLAPSVAQAKYFFNTVIE